MAIYEICLPHAFPKHSEVAAFTFKIEQDGQYFSVGVGEREVFRMQSHVVVERVWNKKHGWMEAVYAFGQLLNVKRPPSILEV